MQSARSLRSEIGQVLILAISCVFVIYVIFTWPVDSESDSSQSATGDVESAARKMMQQGLDDERSALENAIRQRANRERNGPILPPPKPPDAGVAPRAPWRAELTDSVASHEPAANLTSVCQSSLTFRAEGPAFFNYLELQMNRILNLILSAALFFCCAGNASTGFADDLAEKLKALEKRDAFAGAVLLAKGDSVIFSDAVGEASRRYGVKNKLDTKFNIASTGHSGGFFGIMCKLEIHVGRDVTAFILSNMDNAGIPVLRAVHAKIRTLD